MSVRRTRIAARLAAPFVALLLAGCGDPVLWARWRAERAFWHAQRDVERILVRPQVARPADYARAEAAFRAIVEQFPASRWAHSGGTRMEGDVAEIAARSSLALARLAELQQRLDEAVAGYARAETEWALLPELALEAAVLRATALDRAGLPARALAAWEHVARAFPPADSVTGRRRPAHLAAVQRLARGLEERGSAVALDSLLAAEERRAETELAAQRGRPAMVEWLDAIAEARALRGDVAGAMEAQRRALSGQVPMGSAERARRILELGERLLEFGRVDSALRYARWGVREFEGVSRLAALGLEARTLAAGGRRDSALAVYDVVLHDYPRVVDAAAEARFQRGVILEQLDRWVLARAEYSALSAAYPTHPRALESWTRVIGYHRRSGQEELARIEAEHALTAIDQMLAMQHDDAERARAREARVAVLVAAGRLRDASRELQDLWSGSGVRASSAALGEAIARDVETGLRDPALARSLWQILARSSPDRDLRMRAAAALERLPS